MIDPRVVIRPALPEDAEAVRSLGVSDAAFSVSPQVPFYETQELVAWAGNPRDNVLLVSEVDGTVGGFLFCKIMSTHWALLDNFYVSPRLRKTGASDRLFERLMEELRARSIEYLSILVKEGEAALIRTCERRGFVQQQRYMWLDMFIDGHE
jgi:GNAT superfamily N-acetyltransferase